jgi:hypothetical protein
MTRSLRFAPLLALPVALVAQAPGPRPPALPEADRARLAESYRLAAAVADSLWPGWGAVPFEVVLVTADHEYLVRPARTPRDFQSLGLDSMLGSEVWVRPRTFAPDLLATFPAFGLPPTVIVGQPERTGKTDPEWVISALHEHFHQFQMGDSDYVAAAARLDLAGGDETGMWMLNWPFPYDSAPVRAAYDTLSLALAAAVAAIGSDAFTARVGPVPHAVADLVATLSPAAQRYFWLQIWQEGVSRYVELRVAEAAGPPYADVARKLRRGVLRALAQPDLAAHRRSSFYALGAGLALVLDVIDPEWRARYRAKKFAPLF